MAMYWRVQPNRIDYRLLVDDGNIYNSQDFLGVSSRDVDQRRLKFKLDDQTNNPVPDFFPTGHPGTLFVREATIQAFGEIMSDAPHQIYKVRSKMDDIRIYAPMHERMCFDYDSSKYSLFDDGDIDVIFELKILDTCQSPFHIFRLGDNFRPRFEILVSSEFKSVYDENGMTGLRFTPTS